MPNLARSSQNKAKPNLTTMKKIKQFCEKYKMPYTDIEKT